MITLQDTRVGWTLPGGGLEPAEQPEECRRGVLAAASSRPTSRNGSTGQNTASSRPEAEPTTQKR